MRRAAFIFLAMSLARPAWADLSVETTYSENILLWHGRGRTREQIRSDRSRIETWSHEAELINGSERQMHEIQIVRADKHLRWELQPDSMTYREYPWPDTVETAASDPEARLERARADSLARGPKTPTLPRRTGEHQLINGSPAERFYLRSEPDSSGIDSSGRGASELEIWALVDKRDKDIHRLMEVANQHSLLSRPRSELDPMLSSPVDPWAGLGIVPIRATFKVAMLDSAQVRDMNQQLRAVSADSLKAAKAAMPEMFEDVDFVTGKLTMFRIDVTALHLGPVPDEAFEVPAGYKKVFTPPRGHSPR